MAYKFAYSTNAYTKFPIIEAIGSIKKLGFDGVELLADKPHLFATAITREELASISSNLKSLSLVISNINANTAEGLGSIIETDNDKKKMRIQYTKQCINVAYKLGADNISISTGEISKGCSTKQTDNLLLDSLEQILAYAEQFNIKIGIEYEPTFHIHNTLKLLWLINELEHPLLGANLDIGHAYVEGEKIKDILSLLEGKIWNMHIEDIKDKKHYHLIPGEGDINFREVRVLLDKIGYNGFLTLELYTYKDNPENAGAKGLKYLKEIFKSQVQ